MQVITFLSEVFYSLPLGKMIVKTNVKVQADTQLQSCHTGDPEFAYILG